MGVRGGREIARRRCGVADGVGERAAEAFFALHRQVRQEEREHDGDRRDGADRERDPEARDSPEAPRDGEEQRRRSRPSGRQRCRSTRRRVPARASASPSTSAAPGEGRRRARCSASIESGMPPAISSWMWALCEKKYGQNANRIAATAAAPLLAGEAPREQPRADERRAEREEQRGVVRRVRVVRSATTPGLATTPPRMLASEKASAWRWG